MSPAQPTAPRLAVVGAGNMAEAILRGAFAAGVLGPDEVVAADFSPARRGVMAGLGVAAVEDAASAIGGAEAVLLAVKPQALGSLGALGRIDRDAQVVVSIMAGVRCDRIAHACGGPTRVVRVMPNTPLLVGRGASAIASGPDARDGDDALALELFGAAGVAVRVSEAELDAVTAVSGSGPAYLFHLAEAMQAAAVGLGLAPELADTLVRQTLLGSAALLAASDADAPQLRARVTSPGGTTQAATEVLENRGVQDSIRAAIAAAAARSAELAG
ncbi:pyrroline-5-carboxylate reductase [Phycisphaera mikurensis]|uniref:Pyrroline-5-carboxylate reductase n=1 Tax=Phycisphaera mikurensis (strain NBRC 102666 / KCTC 22515 / FYK2301M01) TaxID=1142394 RepID=I0IEI3_PHYMF|nr:pyrroline-5-carboxylate reductase [Phycisphaera mikurensis]MBB6441470.1 pyrroline-5-carboxylate reductase [Phycisphaera mikurensis]BAM03671.1 pyrroline-5-carboxylate reductase [Phycisphaera mikurensis NBRC 102666]